MSKAIVIIAALLVGATMSDNKTDLRLDHWLHSKPFWVEGGFKEDVMEAIDPHERMSTAEVLETVRLIEGVIDVRYREAVLRERLHAGEITTEEYDSLVAQLPWDNPLAGGEDG